ncbi:MAG: hypothetical protein IPI35_28275 [Deltaproteobacteria bacterium]|nr:hypothetical protein [Deltaproteobacteria bacterium]
MANPPQLRQLEQLLSSSFSPAQLHQLLYGLFGQSFVGSLPPHQYISAAQYFFEVVQRLEMNGYLLNNKMGQSLFAELGKERPGRGDVRRRSPPGWGVSSPPTRQGRSMPARAATAKEHPARSAHP